MSFPALCLDSVLNGNIANIAKHCDEIGWNRQNHPREARSGKAAAAGQGVVGDFSTPAYEYRVLLFSLSAPTQKWLV